MNITDITKLAGANRKRRRVGRGCASGSGKTCGRGGKGATARTGYHRHKLQEGGQMPMFRRIPKRGFSNVQFAQRYSVVNVGDLEERFSNDTHVTAQSLLEAGLVRHLRCPIKVLGEGELRKKLRIDAAKFSQSAREKIEKAGGEARTVS